MGKNTDTMPISYKRFLFFWNKVYLYGVFIKIERRSKSIMKLLAD